MVSTHQFHCYLNTDNPMVEWETAIGRIASVCAVDGIETKTSIWRYSRLRQYAQAGMIEHIRDEFQLEKVRQEHFPNCVSRLTGLYFCDSSDDVKLAINRWRLPAKRYDQIATVNFTAENLTRVDSEWITNCLGKSRGDEKWMHSYWSGETYGIRPLKEVLASGWGLIEETERRIECYKSVFEKWPKSSLLLALGAASFNCVIMGLDENCERVSQIMPHVFNHQGKVSGNYGINKGFGLRGTNMKNWLEICAANGWEFPVHPEAKPPPNNPGQVTLPDFKGYFEFEIDDEETLSFLLK